MSRLYHEITRAPGTDDETCLEAYIEFSSRLACKGCAPSWNDPGWADEWEHTVNEVGFVVSAAQPNPPAMTDVERAECVAYFEAHQGDADEKASDAADDFLDAADYEYDRLRDERMAFLEI
jgi:hypothetical protein